MLASALRFAFVNPQPRRVFRLAFFPAMPGIVWDQLDLVTMARLSVELIREEYALRQSV